MHPWRTDIENRQESRHRPFDLNLQTQEATLKSEDAVKLIHCDKADELMSWLARRNEIWNDMPDRWIFRGHADSEWALLPSTLRPGAKINHGPPREGPYEKNSHQVGVELQLVLSFVELANQQGLPIPGDALAVMQQLNEDWFHSDTRLQDWAQFPPVELVELFALAQHHGVPTRLMDWTQDAHVAAYFAAVKAAERAGVDDPPETERLGIWCMNNEVFARQDSAASEQLLQVTIPRAANKNLHAQEGLFTVHVHPLDGEQPPLATPLDKLVNDTSKLREWPRYLSAAMILFTLPVVESPALLRRLATERVTAAKLFPGYDGVVKEMDEASRLRETWRAGGPRY